MSKSQSPLPAAVGTASSRDIFQAADETTQEIIKQVLAKEREVQHLRRRPDIHKDILAIIKRTIT
jgi:septum formation topological specificity factor MinE